jgi:hypothetical protein
VISALPALGLNLFYALETALVKTRGSVVRDLDLHSCNMPVFQALRWDRILHGGIVPIRRLFLALFMHRRQLAVRLQFAVRRIQTRSRCPTFYGQPAGIKPARSLPHELSGIANSEIKSARDLKKTGEACGLIVAGFVSLDLLRLDAKTCSQVLLRQSGSNASLD